MTDHSLSSLEVRIAEVVHEVLQTPTATFQPALLIREDLGADSMQVIALMIAFDAEFDVEFNADEIPASGVSMGWLRDFIAAALNSKKI